MDYHNLLTRVLSGFTKRIKPNDSSLTDELARAYVNCWHYAMSETKDEPYDSVALLTELRTHYRELPNGLLGGNMQLVWLLARLSRDEILEMPKDMMSMAYDVVARNLAYYTNSPIQVDLRQRFYSIGVGMLSLHSSSDTISRYAWEEQIIFKLCDCEKFLTNDISHIYSPKMLTAGILHSVLAFADLCIKYGIYPYKAHQVKGLAITAEYSILKSDPVDVVILNTMCNNPSAINISAWSDDELCRLLNEAGMLSMMYENGDLFAKLLNLVKECQPGVIDRIIGNDENGLHLPGIAMGLINLTKNDETEHS